MRRREIESERRRGREWKMERRKELAHKKERVRRKKKGR